MKSRLIISLVAVEQLNVLMGGDHNSLEVLE